MDRLRAVKFQTRIAVWNPSRKGLIGNDKTLPPTILLLRQLICGSFRRIARGSTEQFNCHAAQGETDARENGSRGARCRSHNGWQVLVADRGSPGVVTAPRLP